VCLFYRLVQVEKFLLHLKYVQVSWERLGEARRNTCRILLSQQYIGSKKAEPGRHIHPDPVLQYMNTSRNNVTSAGISIDRPSPF
jgi:hypothetical protein